MISISFARKLSFTLLVLSLAAISVQARLDSEKTQQTRPGAIAHILEIIKSFTGPRHSASAAIETDVVLWPANEKTPHERLLHIIRDSLTKDVLIEKSAGNANSEHFFTLYVPANAAGLELTATGGSGDIDLYVRYGALPTTASYDCRSAARGTYQSCGIANPKKGTYYVMLRGNAHYWGVSVTGAYDLVKPTIPSVAISPAIDISPEIGTARSKPESPRS